MINKKEQYKKYISGIAVLVLKNRISLFFNTEERFYYGFFD